MKEILQAYIDARFAADGAHRVLMNAISNVKNAVNRSEIKVETHYRLGSVIVYVAHPESNGPAVEIVAEDAVSL